MTQDVEDFLATPEGHTLLANSSVQILMRQDSSTIDVVSQTFRLSSGEREFLLACQKGEALFFAHGDHRAAALLQFALAGPSDIEAALDIKMTPLGEALGHSPAHGVPAAARVDANHGLGVMVTACQTTRPGTKRLCAYCGGAEGQVATTRRSTTDALSGGRWQPRSPCPWGSSR